MSRSLPSSSTSSSLSSSESDAVNDQHRVVERTLSSEVQKKHPYLRYAFTLLSGVPRLVEYFLFYLGRDADDPCSRFNADVFVDTVKNKLSLPRVNNALKLVHQRANKRYCNFVNRLNGMIHMGAADRLLLWAMFGQQVSRNECIVSELGNNFTVDMLENEGTVFVSKHRPSNPWTSNAEVGTLGPTSAIMEPVWIIIPYIWLQTLHESVTDVKKLSIIGLYCSDYRQELSPDQNELLSLRVIAEKIRLKKADYEYKCKLNPSLLSSKKWTMNLSDLFSIDADHPHSAQLRQQQISLPVSMNFNCYNSPRHVLSGNIDDTFATIEATPINFLLNAQRAPFADSMCRFIEPLYLLIQDKQSVTDRYHRIQDLSVNDVTYEQIQIEYNKCSAVPADKFLFVYITDLHLSSDAYKKLRPNMIVVHAGNDHLFYGPMLSLRKLFASPVTPANHMALNE